MPVYVLLEKEYLVIVPLWGSDDRIINEIRRETSLDLSPARRSVAVPNGSGDTVELPMFTTSRMLLPLKAFMWLKTKRAQRYIEFMRIEYNSRWNSTEYEVECPAMPSRPDELRELFRACIAELKVLYRSHSLGSRIVSDACRLVRMADQWSESALSESACILLGVIARVERNSGRVYNADGLAKTLGLSSEVPESGVIPDRYWTIAVRYPEFRPTEDSVRKLADIATAVLKKGWHHNASDFREATLVSGKRASALIERILNDLPRVHRIATSDIDTWEEYRQVLTVNDPAGFEIDRVLSSSSALKIVYSARQLRSGRRVALKRYKHIHDFDKRGRVSEKTSARELEIVQDTIAHWLGRDGHGRLHHTNIVPCDLVYGSGGQPFIVEPLMDHTLARYEQEALPQKDAVAYMSDVSSAVAYLHNQGVIHCDIKLDNIGVEQQRAMLLDFGLSNHVDTQVPRTMGTIRTRAPELFFHDCRPSFAADVFSLGACFYALLTHGNYPFVTREEILALAPRGETERREFECLVETRIQKAREDPMQWEAKLDERLREFWPPVRRLVSLACAIEPKHRPSAFQFQSQLKRIPAIAV